MKGVVIFDERADLAFHCLDKEMERFILERMQELELEHSGPSVSPYIAIYSHLSKRCFFV